MSFPECVEHAKQIKYFFNIAINQRQKYVIGTEFTFIQSLVTEGSTKMILLLMIISASNGKYFLIKTSDNKTNQDYMRDDNRAGPGGCEPASVFSRREVACRRGSVL